MTNLNSPLRDQVQHKIDNKTKPLGALGVLEEIALKIALIQQTDSPTLSKPHILVFAGDHGIATEGVSPYPQEVTYQMVLNFVYGGAAINVFCRQHNITLKVIDAGVNGNFDGFPQVIKAKIGPGTRNFLHQPAMTMQECEAALQKGRDIVNQVHAEGCNIIGFGEMGISNTSAAAILMHKFTGQPLENCVGRGTGLDDEGVQRKLAVLSQAVKNQPCAEPREILSTFGGFEIVQICGAMLQAAENNMALLIDGFIATSALLAAHAMQPGILDNCLFCHQSDEAGHRRMLAFLKAKPILELQMRLGEGTGCAVAYPIIQSAVNFLNEMASFDSAGVSQRE